MWVALWTLLAWAGDAPSGLPLEARATEVRPWVEPEPDALGSGFRFLALAQTRAAFTNVTTTNPFLNGQVVGTLGGTNGTTVESGARTAYTSFRVNGFFTYAPPVLSNRAELGAAFEVDFAFGDQSYSTGGNTGGGFGADQVNLQTRRLYVGLRPNLGANRPLHVLVGLQFLGDSVNDPTASRADDLLRSGGRFFFFASEAAGIAAYGRVRDGWGDRLRYRAGVFTLYEEGLGTRDDVWMGVLDAQVHTGWNSQIGVHGWFLSDRASGSGGVLGSGPTSSLSEMMGGPRLDLRASGETEAPTTYANLLWTGLDGSWNAQLDRGPVGVHAMGFANLGALYTPDVTVPVRGAIGAVELRARWAPGDGSIARVEALYSTPDRDGDDAYTGVFTGNSYGVAGAMHLGHGGHLLFPDITAINRQVSVVQDVSGGGRGVLGLDGGLAYDVVPGRLTASTGVNHAWAADGGLYGTEVHGHLKAEVWLFLNVGVHGAYAWVGDAAQVDVNPWTLYATLDWLVF